jgi:hypothetical protein
MLRPRVNADLVFGARISNIVAIAWGVIAFGLFSVFGGGYLVYGEIRRRRSSEGAIHVSDLREPEPVDTEADIAGLSGVELVNAAGNGNDRLLPGGHE